MMKEFAMATLVAGGACAADAASASLPLTREWDKTFPKPDKVEHAKATVASTMYDMRRAR